MISVESMYSRDSPEKLSSPCISNAYLSIKSFSAFFQTQNVVAMVTHSDLVALSSSILISTD